MSLQLAVNFFGSSWSGQIVYVYGNLAIVLLLEFGFNGSGKVDVRVLMGSGTVSRD
jgi:hypothetical protein